jgi:predicted secreted protein
MFLVHPSIPTRVKDARSKKVIFLSHCILNENTRYLGGAPSPACARPVVEQCIENHWGMVQMPCPEQQAWGGVLKRLFLLAYGAKGSRIYRFRNIILPLFTFYSKWVYRRLARKVAAEITDYIASGYEVVAVAGIDGSPSCGLHTTLALPAAFDRFASIRIEELTTDESNRAVRESLTPGPGMFTSALASEFANRNLDVPYLAHDLIAELSGDISPLNATGP